MPTQSRPEHTKFKPKYCQKAFPEILQKSSKILSEILLKIPNFFSKLKFPKILKH